MVPTNLREATTQPGNSPGGYRFGIRKLAGFYGFTDPPDFARAIPCLAAVIFLLVVIVAAVCEAHFGKMHFGTFRFFYFIYVGSAAAAGAMLSFAPRLAWALIALSFTEFSLGFTSGALTRMHVFDRSIMPADIIEHEYKFHPLLQGVPTPNYLQLWPVRDQHDSYGLRGNERDAAQLKRQVVIAAVGGSTTYGVGVADDQTWPDVLEHELGSQYAVLNHGVPSYSTAEHLIQTLFYLDSYGVTPRCAVYYVGWNDIHNAHLPKLDPGYADFHQLYKISALEVRKTPLAAEISPIAYVVVRYLQLWLDTIPPADSAYGQTPGQGSDSRLETIYRRNLESIAAINQKRGITTIFVGQILNRARLRDDKTYAWWPLVRDADLWPLQERFNAILKEAAEATASPVFIPQIEQFQDSDFLDNGHFSAQGSKKFAAMLAPFVRANCARH